MFASRSTRVLDVPQAPGNTVTIRRLSWKHLREAREVVERRALGQLRELGGAAALKDIRAAEAAATPAPAPANGEAAAAVALMPEPEVDPFPQYDPEIMLRHGVVAFSGVNRVTPDVLADLEPEPADWIARQIFAFSTEQYSAEQEKNA
jgi:hypothetical protein